MIYLLYGTQEYLIEEKIKEIIKLNDIDKYNIETFNMENDSLKDIIDSSNTFSLFADKKIIIVDNSFIFTGSTKKQEEADITILDKYLDNINENTLLIFKINNEKLDSRKKIVTKIKKVSTVIEYNKLIDINSKVKELFSPYKIDNNTVQLLIERVSNDLEILSQEIDKIKTYKDKDLNITKEDIISLTNKNINTDIFYLLDSILNKMPEQAIESYNEMIKIGEEPIKILVMLANQFRLIYQVKELSKKGYREYDIMNILDQKQYTIKKACERISKYQDKELLKYINELSELDINIKSGLIDKNIGLQLFILNIKKETL